MTLTLAQLADQTGAELNNASFADVEISAVAPVSAAGQGQISFIANPKYKKHLEACKASAMILHPELAADYSQPALISTNPYATYARVAGLLSPVKMPAPQIHASAVVDASASIGQGCYIGPHCVIEAGAKIGNHCYLAAGVYIGEDSSVGDSSRINANVSVYNNCRIGQRNIIHSGAVIGADGFGFAPDQGQWIKVPQTGGVTIGDQS